MFVFLGVGVGGSHSVGWGCGGDARPELANGQRYSTTTTTTTTATTTTTNNNHNDIHTTTTNNNNNNNHDNAIGRRVGRVVSGSATARRATRGEVQRNGQERCICRCL